MPPLGVNKLKLDGTTVYNMILTGYSTPNGTDSNRQNPETEGVSIWFDNNTQTLTSNKQAAAVLPLGTPFPCKLTKSTNVYQGALHLNKITVQRVGFEGEVLFVVVQNLAPPNTIHAVLMWQCYDNINKEDSFPLDFDGVMTVPRNEVDKRITAWFKESRRRDRLQRDARRRAERAARDSAKRSQVRSLDFKKGDWFDLMLLKATR